MALHNNLRKIISDRGLTVRELAEAVGIKRSTLSDWLAGASPRDLNEVYRLSKHLGISLEALLFNEPMESVQPTFVDLYFDGPVRIRIEKLNETTRRK
jgi:transcriptional regulator with XRE-family HTH domain